MSQHCGHETLNSLTDFDQLIVSIITEVAVGNEGDDGEYGWHVQYANAARPYICQPTGEPIPMMGELTSVVVRLDWCNFYNVLGPKR